MKEIVEEIRRNLQEIGLSGERLEQEILIICGRQEVMMVAREAFKQGVPQDQGPVWFADEVWKTDFWKRQWEWQKAYQEGEDVRSRFGSRDENPYLQESLPFTSRLIELEYLWNMGFDGKILE